MSPHPLGEDKTKMILNLLVALIMGASITLSLLTWTWVALAPGLLILAPCCLILLRPPAWIVRFADGSKLLIDPWLVLVVSAGAVIVALFGFRNSFLARRMAGDDVFENWHRGAI